MTRRLLALLAVAGCVPPVGTAGSGCPCADGYVCCGCWCVPEGEPCGDEELEVGEGTPTAATFRPLGEDGRMALYHGPQGGYHLFLQARTEALDPGDVRFVRRLIDPDTLDQVRSQDDAVTLVDDPQGPGYLIGQEQITFVCPRLDPGPRVHDRDLGLCVEMYEASAPDRILRASRLIRPTCPEGDRVCPENNRVGCAARP